MWTEQLNIPILEILVESNQTKRKNERSGVRERDAVEDLRRGAWERGSGEGRLKRKTNE